MTRQHEFTIAMLQAFPESQRSTVSQNSDSLRLLRIAMFYVLQLHAPLCVSFLHGSAFLTEVSPSCTVVFCPRRSPFSTRQSPFSTRWSSFSTRWSRFSIRWSPFSNVQAGVTMLLFCTCTLVPVWGSAAMLCCALYGVRLPTRPDTFGRHMVLVLPLLC